MFWKKVIISLLFLALSLNLLLPTLALAQSDIGNAFNGLTNAAIDAQIINSANEKGLTSYQILGRIINIVLGFLSLIFLGLCLYSGIRWMTAQGNEEKASQSLETLTGATIGLVIILASFILSNYVIFKIIGFTN